MAKDITTEELKNKLEDNENVYLIDTLSPESFATKHLPGAKNVPDGPDFAQEFESKIGADKNAEVILYCASETCQASVRAAAKLEEAGYTNVAHYVDGLAGWQNAGHKFEGESAE